jgi:hypothetical protein
MTGAAQVLLAAIPLAALVLVGVLGFFTLLWDHQRRLTIIRQGGTPPPRDFGDKLFLIGLVSAFVGSGLVLFFWATRGMGDWVLTGIVPAAAGFAIIFHRSVMSQKPK